jgi:dihydroorotate dehydrogenase electron transfer subunit
MTKILENTQISKDFYLMKVERDKAKEQEDTIQMGQFYMVRAWDKYPLLSRPISVFDADENSVSFLYQAIGEGTKILSTKVVGETISIDRPHGNGFPNVTGKIALVGGGVGVAPLFYATKKLREYAENMENSYREDDKNKTIIDMYLGFREETLLIEEYERVADSVTVNIGGFVTEDIDTTKYDVIMTCGPEVMMKVLWEKCKKQGTKATVYASLENRMACGIGACLVCTCKTPSGNKRACKDGPVLLAKEIFEV